MKLILIVLMASLLFGCINSGRYSIKHDSAPKQIPTTVNQTAVEPYFVEHAPANKRPYTVFGKRYFPLKSGKGYVATGEASWYGQKFHGHLTANGEVYNMYDMTAAHKTLPLPSFVRVTNLDNNRKTIVRVNDRGPFHDDRLIDLSWAAAKKLGVLKHGTANVKVEVIHVDENGQVTLGDKPIKASEDVSIAENLLRKPSTSDSIARTMAHSSTEKQNTRFIQVAASRNSEKLNELARGLAYMFHLPTHTPKSDDMYRLRLGPLTEDTDAKTIIEELKRNGFDNAFEVNVSL